MQVDRYLKSETSIFYLLVEKIDSERNTSIYFFEINDTRA